MGLGNVDLFLGMTLNIFKIFQLKLKESLRFLSLLKKKRMISHQRKEEERLNTRSNSFQVQRDLKNTSLLPSNVHVCLCECEIKAQKVEIF